MPDLILPPLPSLEHCQIRHIPGFPSYAVTDTGEVWSSRPWKHEALFITWKRLSCCRCKRSGYIVATLRTHKQIARRVHGLVLEAFIGAKPPEMLARHLNGCHQDNRLANLAWGTIVENGHDYARHRKEGRGTPSFAQPIGPDSIIVQLAKPLPTSNDTMIPQFPDIPGVAIKEIRDFPGYAITSNGDLLSCRRFGYKQPRYTSFWHAKKVSTIKIGYKLTRLTIGKKQKTFYIHQLVLEYFVGPRPPGYYACHNNGKRDDNRLSNLRWDTPAQNGLDKHKHGTMSPSKLDAIQVVAIRQKYREGMSQTAIGKQYGVTNGSIGRIVHRKSWAHLP